MEVYVGACGCICSDCRAFGTDCGGCFAIAGKPVWLPEVNLEVCDFYECSVLDRGFKHCGECSEIPCNKFWENKNPAWTEEQHRQIVEERTKLLLGLAKG
ncbi:MAG TPA: DUF3795 domain-containing protein [Firmicutes bacterium]|jgi:hypothetical protein|nr:DUF3795 domain-containing protein [Bacillota bacterium]HHT42051.1 DUF3795 domain-containing protein [Bacillota bacterium]